MDIQPHHKIHPDLAGRVQEYLEAQAEAQEAMRKVRHTRLILVGDIAVVLGTPGENIIIGHWDCPRSPVGVCLYRDDEECVCCGQPMDRT